MAFSFLKRLFNSEPKSVGTLPPMNSDAEPTGRAPAAAAAKSSANRANTAELNKFVNYVARALVDQPEQVSLTQVEKGDLTVIQIHCFKSDIGKVIGKSGKTISAIRTLVNSVSSHKGQRITVDVMDD